MVKHGLVIVGACCLFMLNGCALSLPEFRDYFKIKPIQMVQARDYRAVMSCLINGLESRQAYPLAYEIRNGLLDLPYEHRASLVTYFPAPGFFVPTPSPSMELIAIQTSPTSVDVSARSTYEANGPDLLHAVTELLPLCEQQLTASSPDADAPRQSADSTVRHPIAP